MPLSLDSSLAMRPDLGVPARDAQPSRAIAEQREQFTQALSRAERVTPASPGAAPTLVRAARTQLSGEQAASALRSAWTETRGEPPRPETLSILVGQWAHETGRGAAMLNYNFGGIKGTGPSGLSAACSTREGWGENEVRVVDRFRAYGSAEEGARDYVSLLARRYPDAVRAADSGDAKGFVQALKARGYFTDNEAAYTKSVQSLASLALSAGFDAVGSGGGALDAPPAPAFGAEALAGGVRAPHSLPLAGLLDGGALLELAPELATSQLPGAGPFHAVAPGAFADEVNRAALLMSALRIAEPRSRRG